MNHDEMIAHLRDSHVFPANDGLTDGFMRGVHHALHHGLHRWGGRDDKFVGHIHEIATDTVTTDG